MKIATVFFLGLVAAMGFTVTLASVGLSCQCDWFLDHAQWTPQQTLAANAIDMIAIPVSIMFVFLARRAFLIPNREPEEQGA